MMRHLARTLVVCALALSACVAEASAKTVRIGYQKYGNLILLKTKGSLEGKLKAIGYDVTWTEFPSGPPLLEAINAGAIDFGTTGEAPPVFAQAAGVPLVYVANEPPAPLGEAIIVRKDSPIRGVADLKGKKVALNKGANVHYLLVRALEKAGVAYSDITPVFLAPADARAAFVRGAVDAWAIWDPYLASAQAATGARTLTTGEGIVPNVQFYLAATTFAADSPQAVDIVLSALDEIDRWASQNQDAVSEQLSAAINVPVPVIAAALKRQGYGVKRVDAAVAAGQQKVADAFYALGLIPKPIVVTDIVRKSGS